MSLDKILAISGKPGLYELKAQTRTGFVAESLTDNKKISVSLRHNVSILSEIAIYTYAEEVPLREVFQKIQTKENGEKTIGHKENKKVLETYFREILPEYDEDRVYGSDIKKVIQWYNLLVENGITDFSEKEDTGAEKEVLKKKAASEEE